MSTQVRHETEPSGAHPAPVAEAEFLRLFPDYRQTRILDELRRTDFARLERLGQIYLDYTGGGLYAESQVRRHMELLVGRVFGNPHSANPTSLATTELIERCRRRVLDYFNASPDEYAVIFTANASNALKLVGESYPFRPGDRFLLTFDNHNSVNGLREFDRAHGAETTYVPVIPPEMRVDDAHMDEHLATACKGSNNLFAYPAQSNFSGVQHPLEWIERAQKHGWDVLLDAAAFVPTNRLDLSRYRPDYVALSFYKMFGYPTGVGALIARWPALGKLHRPWFAGGTIEVASVQADTHSFAAGSAAFEDGTLDYTNIPAVELGLDFLESVGIETIHTRVRCLTGWLVRQLLALRHANGRPLVSLYGPAGTDRRGGAVALNFLTEEGRLIDHQEVERRAAERQISLRTGCFCNPGAGEMALGLSRDEIVACFDRQPERTMTYEEFRGCIDEKGTGAVRVSIGPVTTFRDVSAFLDFANEFRR
ncbi:MAG: aminotransferase class V-fold PLP-dependent enzyme [Thermoanaerobaculia bacterium]|nr:aminotransferase class V-fold PLP-dependent enzyme [Thermoanaerobaculia bacterium]